jgi:hypothetical protein
VTHWKLPIGGPSRFRSLFDMDLGPVREIPLELVLDTDQLRSGLSCLLKERQAGPKG